jgi:hypothetical protein
MESVCLADQAFGSSKGVSPAEVLGDLALLSVTHSQSVTGSVGEG